MPVPYDAAVIGGGFFGAMVALHLRRGGRRVVLLEREEQLLRRASYHNQARVHNGYHYPRSLVTAVRSRINFPRFVEGFASAIERRFEKYYAVARQHSKVSARQFRTTFESLGAPITDAPRAVRRLFSPHLIEDVFGVQEYAFDAARLRTYLARALADEGVEVRLRNEVQRVSARAGGGDIELQTQTPAGAFNLHAGQVVHCAYANLNQVLVSSGLPRVPIKLELAEMALVEPPPPLRKLGVTVMCGPFFSIMPFPSRGLHTLSHVRYTPHSAWNDDEAAGRSAYEIFEQAPKQTNYPYMVRDSARYLPMVAGCRYVESLFELKAVLPRNEQDDGRPILFLPHHGLPNFHCVLGAKVDNVFDLLERLDNLPEYAQVA